MNPITLPLPVWERYGPGWAAPIGESLRLVAMPVREERRWSWEVQTRTPSALVGHCTSWTTHHERTPEAAQAAAWDALAKWLGATV